MEGGRFIQRVGLIGLSVPIKEKSEKSDHRFNRSTDLDFEATSKFSKKVKSNTKQIKAAKYDSNSQKNVTQSRKFWLLENKFEIIAQPDNETLIHTAYQTKNDFRVPSR